MEVLGYPAQLGLVTFVIISPIVFGNDLSNISILYLKSALSHLPCSVDGSKSGGIQKRSEERAVDFPIRRLKALSDGEFGLSRYRVPCK